MSAASTASETQLLWPALPADSWTDTRDTLHMWTQIVGKTRMALCPMLNHWWQVPLYVMPRGLSTGTMPYAAGSCEVVLDFHRHELQLYTSDGQVRHMALAPRSVADFYHEYRSLLRAAGVAATIWPVPVEVADTTSFTQDQHHCAYDATAVQRFWRILLQADQVFGDFRSHFTGKASPVHFFWGSFDLAVTRFSGRPAPPHPGGVPNVGDWVMREAYSAEVSSAGWWPGGNGSEAIFYSYAYPTPPGFAEVHVRPAQASFNTDLGEFVLPYEQVRTADNPRQLVLDFLQSTYEAAANLAHWDRKALERH